MIVECNVWCVAAPKEQIEMGLPEGDQWLPIAIDFDRIDAIKLAGDNEFLGNDKALIYFNGNSLTIDISYIEAVRIWQRNQK
jgi:hypothetical protein